MRQTIAFLMTGFVLALVPGTLWAQTPTATTQHLEHLMIDNADTPAEHEALARYYRMKAADAKSLAEEHRTMAKHYTAGNMGAKRKMKEHCDKIADLNEELAAQYEELAKGEEAAAQM